ncbi:aldo/keto reductase [Teredinibacter turnerae T7901]|uniref:Aldo/keto reductase n=1 Tax=Teredinibacter turnerae (strain ATCC 39867 / T7901) TaxID=377629 RepID=C5BLS3_TERTT|nr:aldo/keto reductase [Teredinibacter turnerae]ACR11499.1 aldo/keto reductase [Teredinibacter turnerae T7901]
MKQRILGSSKLEVSEVGLGCWQLGGDFGPVTEARAQEIIETALAEGVTFFDTADVYGAGQSESYLGKALANAGSDIKIATKYGRGPGTYPDGYSLVDLRDSVKRAQDRLGRDCLDLLQLHCIPTEVMRRGEIFDFLREVQQEGHIAHFGSSVETIEEALICCEQDDLASLQIIFNLFRQQPLKKLFDTAKARDVGIIVRLPLASGLLSGKFSANTQFDETDHRNYNKDGDAFSVGETFSGIEFSRGLELVNTLEGFKPESLTFAQFAMRWILDHDAVTTIIPGASSKAQVESNVSVSDLAELPADLHEKLFAFYEAEVEQHIRCPL